VFEVPENKKKRSNSKEVDKRKEEVREMQQEVELAIADKFRLQCRTQRGTRQNSRFLKLGLTTDFKKYLLDRSKQRVWILLFLHIKLMICMNEIIGHGRLGQTAAEDIDEEPAGKKKKTRNAIE
jgi:hypothetical protein